MTPDGDDQLTPPPAPVPSVPLAATPGASTPGPAVAVPPAPVPEVGGVTDEDRNRYGVLLYHAAERGLLSGPEYQARLVELADATSLDQMRRIVTELPVFGAPGGVPASDRASGSPSSARPGPGSPSGAAPGDLEAALWAARTPANPRRSRGNPWVILLVVVAVLAVALVVLALVAAHYSHHHTGSTPVAGALLSRLRP